MNLDPKRQSDGQGFLAGRFPQMFAAASCAILIAAACAARAEDPPGDASADPKPIAIVPLEASNRDQAKVTGSLQVTEGTMHILKNGTVTSGNLATNVILPRRGVVRVCPATSLTISADTSIPADQSPGLMLAMDHGAIETSFAAGRNSDVLITPDFRILIAGPGAVDMKVRLGEHGDTCIDNPGSKAPYVVVSGIFDGGAYRVQPDQRVMFQHGKLTEVVDNEKEPCGCPATARPGTNDFPADQSAGLAPLQIGHAPDPQPKPEERAAAPPHLDTTLTYPHVAEPDPKPESSPATAPAPQPAPPPVQPAPKPEQKKKGFFHRLGGFFHRIFGGE